MIVLQEKEIHFSNEENNAIFKQLLFVTINKVVESVK